MYFCIIYNYLYNLQLCLTCMEMKLMDSKIPLNLESLESFKFHAVAEIETGKHAQISVISMMFFLNLLIQNKLIY